MTKLRFKIIESIMNTKKYTFNSIYHRFYVCYIKYLNENVVLSDPKLSVKPNEITDDEWIELSKNRCSISNYAFANVMRVLLDRNNILIFNNRKIENIETIAGKYNNTEHVWIKILFVKENNQEKDYIYWDVGASQFGINNRYNGYPSYIDFDIDNNYIIDDINEIVLIKNRMKILYDIRKYSSYMQNISNVNTLCNTLDAIEKITEYFMKGL